MQLWRPEFEMVGDLACKERKCGGTSASRDENGQVDVWRSVKR